MTNSTPSKKRGRPLDPNKLVFREVGIRPPERQWLRLWRQNPDDPPVVPGSPEDNLTEQLGFLIEAAMRFWPEGNNFASGWPRDEKGRFARRMETELLLTASEGGERDA